MKFEVEVEPATSWADEIYLGNIIAEVLGKLGSESKSFKLVNVKRIQETDQKSES